jgi:tetratricopeptide (TPR) repeat protein
MAEMPTELAGALRDYEAGRLPEAETRLRRMLHAGSRVALIPHILGLIALRTGRAAEAEAQIRRAIAIEPRNHVFHGNLAMALKALDRMDEAVAALHHAVDLKPDYVTGLLNLGVVLLERGDGPAAAQCYRQILTLQPGNAAAHFGLGNAYARGGEPERAIAAFRAAIRLRPDDPQAQNNLGNALADIGDLAGAAAAVEAACRLQPGDYRLWLNLARKRELTGDWVGAAATLAQGLASVPDNVELLAERLRFARLAGDEAQADALLERLLALAPSRAQTYAETAFYREGQHALDAAEVAATRALELDPMNATATLVTARLARRAGDLVAARRRLEALLDRQDDADAATELGQVLDALDEPAAAFAAFERGKRLAAAKPEARLARPAAYLDLVRRARATVDSADVGSWPTVIADAAGAPIFFVGFPRSGTTLMQEMLAGHPALCVAEELPVLAESYRQVDRHSASGRPYPEGLLDLPDAAIPQLRAAYWEAVARRLGQQPGGRRFVDKLPLNIVHLGFVRRLFPEASVLVALRDPRDVVLSCFMQSFLVNDAMANFAELGNAARLYAAVMDLWCRYREHAGLRYLEYRYEDLVAEPRATLERVAAFLGLSWDEALLDYADRTRGRFVKTPSYAAVAQPLSDRAIGRWRRYSEQLRPVTDLLSPFAVRFGYPAA